MSVSKKLRWQVLVRDGFMCRYCGSAAPDVRLEADHVIPRSKGGLDTLENLVTACEACNRGKSDNEIGEALGTLAQSFGYLLSKGMSPTDAYREVEAMRESVVQRLYMSLDALWSVLMRPMTKGWPPTYETLRLVERFEQAKVEEAYHAAAKLFQGQEDVPIDRIMLAIETYLVSTYWENERFKDWE